MLSHIANVNLRECNHEMFQSLYVPGYTVTVHTEWGRMWKQSQTKEFLSSHTEIWSDLQYIPISHESEGRDIFLASQSIKDK